jgi:hypothetical protein
MQVLVLSAIGVAATPAAAQATQAEPPRQVSIAAVLSGLRQEARSWARDRTFARDEADYAQTQHVEVPDADVIRMLGRKLHREPAVDAYLKWQLMSFEPDLSGLAESDYQRIIAHLPKLERLPGPTDDTNARVAEALARRQAQRRAERAQANAAVAPEGGAIPPGSDPTLSVVTEGSKLDVTAAVNTGDPRYVTATIRADNAQVGDIRQIPVLAAGNAAAAQARDEVVAAMPAENGVRLIAMFTDLRDRIAAGDASVPGAAKALEREAQDRGAAETLSPALRDQLHDWSAAIVLMRTPVYRVRRIEGTLTDKVSVHWVRVPKRQMQRVAASLRGEDTTTPEAEPSASPGESPGEASAPAPDHIERRE